MPVSGKITELAEARPREVGRPARVSAIFVAVPRRHQLRDHRAGGVKRLQDRPIDGITNRVVGVVVVGRGGDLAGARHELAHLGAAREVEVRAQYLAEFVLVAIDFLELDPVLCVGLDERVPRDPMLQRLHQGDLLLGCIVGDLGHVRRRVNISVTFTHARKRGDTT